jgi:hypothetical protein
VTLEDVEKGEDNAGDVDDGYHEDRGVAEKRMGGGHTVVQEKDRRLGRHERGVVQDRERVDASLEWVAPLWEDLCRSAGSSTLALT